MKNFYNKIGVVIPCYKVKNYINNVLLKIPKNVKKIIIVDDNCPECTGNHVIQFIKNNEILSKKILVIFNKKNLGVGGSVKKGLKILFSYKTISVAVKIDGDGQLNPANINNFAKFILFHNYDYVKGNRFKKFSSVKKIPFIKLLGNFTLSVFHRVMSGYYNLFDCHNGYFALSKKLHKSIKYKEIDDRFFFEPDILFNIYLLKAKVKELSNTSEYSNIYSNLRVSNAIIVLPLKYLDRFIKRLIFVYFTKKRVLNLFYFILLIFITSNFLFYYELNKFLIFIYNIIILFLADYFLAKKFHKN
jgi:dolichol-phosphate mannosyltransferase